MFIRLQTTPSRPLGRALVGILLLLLHVAVQGRLAAPTAATAPSPLVEEEDQGVQPHPRRADKIGQKFIHEMRKKDHAMNSDDHRMASVLHRPRMECPHSYRRPRPRSGLWQR